MNRASSDALDALHGLLADTLISELRAARKRAEKKPDGSPGEPISPQLLDKVMKFLKDNGVDAPAKLNVRITSLAKELQDLDLDAEARPN